MLIGLKLKVLSDGCGFREPSDNRPNRPTVQISRLFAPGPSDGCRTVRTVVGRLNVPQPSDGNRRLCGRLARFWSLLEAVGRFGRLNRGTFIEEEEKEEREREKTGGLIVRSTLNIDHVRAPENRTAAIRLCEKSRLRTAGVFRPGFCFIATAGACRYVSAGPAVLPESE